MYLFTQSVFWVEEWLKIYDDGQFLVVHFVAICSIMSHNVSFLKCPVCSGDFPPYLCYEQMNENV